MPSEDLGLVGKERAVFACPHCDVEKCQHEKVGTSRAYPDSRVTESLYTKKPFAIPTTRTHQIYACTNCGRDTYFLLEEWSEQRATLDPGSAAPIVVPPTVVVHAHAGRAVLLRFPVSSPSQSAVVPQAVRDATAEAEKALAVGAPNASAVMCRRAIHALCEDKKAQGKDLRAQLQHLADTHTITPDLWQWAEELRVAGRSGAHPEWEAVTPDEAEYAVRFLREIIRYTYVNPAEREARRLKEEKKRV